MLVDFIDLRCSVSVPFLPSSLSPQDFAVPASSFLSELKGCVPAGACIHRCFHCTEHLIHCCTVLTQILRKSVALLARFHVFLNALKCLKMHALTQVLMLWKCEWRTSCAWWLERCQLWLILSPSWFASSDHSFTKSCSREVATISLIHGADWKAPLSHHIKYP